MLLRHNVSVTSPQPSPSPAATPDARKDRYTRSLIGVVLSLIIAWGSTLLPLPWMLISGIAALAAIVFLIIMLVAAWPTERRRPSIITAAIGIPACVALVLSAGFSALFYGPMSSYQDCVSTALTDQARAACDEDLPGSITSWLGL